jgi:hypothetical protein
VVSVELQEIRSGPTILPLASRDSAARALDIPTVSGRDGRRVIVTETGALVSTTAESAGALVEATV